MDRKRLGTSDLKLSVGEVWPQLPQQCNGSCCSQTAIGHTGLYSYLVSH